MPTYTACDLVPVGVFCFCSVQARRWCLLTIGVFIAARLKRGETWFWNQVQMDSRL
jgi:hypothetical protein